MTDSERIKRYIELVEFLPQPVFEIDRTGKLIFLNRSGYNMSGYTTEDLGKGVYSHDIIAPEDRDRLLENTRRILNGEYIGETEYTIIKKDGTRFNAVVHSSPIVNDNKISGIRGVIFDVTLRKQAEEKIRNLNSALKVISDINHIINIERSREKLLQSICETLIQNRNYYCGCISLVQDSENLEIVAHASKTKDNSAMLDLFQNPCVLSFLKNSLTKADVAVSDDLGCITELICSDIEYAKKRIMAVRLVYKDEIYGILSVMTSDRILTDNEERLLFQSIGEDIGYALFNIELAEIR